VAVNANKTPKKLFLKKIKQYIKNAEFYADFKTVEKVAKKFAHKKLLTKM
jgi:histone deacetylase complex regulatory component SIN3